jgi:D-glycero-D-manno-heptose 1,7-bisphosphate phosphatase
MVGAQRFVILDRDGVINHDSVTYIKTPEEWRPLKGSLKAIAALTDAGFLVAVITNQSGVGRGLLSEAMLQRIHAKMRSAVEAVGGHIAGIYYCPHRPDEGCDCRKPATGLLDRLEAELRFPLSGTPLIGDKDSDLELARRVGARPILVRTGYGDETLAKLGESVEVYENLAGVSKALLAEASK